MKLSFPEHLNWLVLRRVRRGGVVRIDGGCHYRDNGHPLGSLVVDILGWLDEQDLLEVADPDESGVRPLALTEGGLGMVPGAVPPPTLMNALTSPPGGGIARGHHLQSRAAGRRPRSSSAEHAEALRGFPEPGPTGTTDPLGILGGR